jgi:hypothetical protein
MGLITTLLTLPLAPVRATVALAEQIRQQAEHEFYDPARIRVQLEEIDLMRSSGELSDDEADALEEDLITRLLIAGDRHDKEA